RPRPRPCPSGRSRCGEVLLNRVARAVLMVPQTIVPILAYHQVLPWPLVGPAPARRGLVVPARRFRLQVALLKAFGFTGITLRQWVDSLDGIARLPKKPVILTFDDGYAGIYDY